jgi:hypothetical protein
MNPARTTTEEFVVAFEQFLLKPIEVDIVAVARRDELVIGHWSLVIGHWSLVIGHWSLVVGRWSLVVGH